jgi:hypothetical protein
MAQEEDLGVPWPVRAGKQGKPAEDAEYRQIPNRCCISPSELAGRDHALDLAGALVDLDGRGPAGSFRR